MITHIIFDWGNTLMRDFPEKPGPMYEWDHVELMPGVENLLSNLAERFVLTVATNAGESNTEAMVKALTRVHIEGFFIFKYSSKDLGVSKPDPRFFEEVCKRSGFTPEETLMIGNDYKKDIVGAKAAGMQTILYNHENYIGETPDADYVVGDLGEVLGVV
ncbi:MAG: HAD family hydrolase [Marinilabiliales bacterium]|nr:MAG: HAD family hydrolase [Marinilabiliales bacterium]